MENHLIIKKKKKGFFMEDILPYVWMEGDKGRVKERG